MRILVAGYKQSLCMKWLSQATTAVYAVDVELFPLFLLCQRASICLSSHYSEGNLFFFSVPAPGIAPSLPFPKNCLHLAECGIADVGFFILVILEEQPLPAQGAALPRWAPFRGGVRGAGLPWDPGATCLFCVKRHMCAGERLLWECRMSVQQLQEF